MNPRASRQDQRWQKNREHWSHNLDAQNLADVSAQIPIETQLQLYQTLDIRSAIDSLRPLENQLTFDLGGGLGLMAILLARSGATVIIADLSLPRLKKARQLAIDLELKDQIFCVYGVAENLPFKDESFSRITCKSVLIHTDLARAAAELARVLHPSGATALIEPMTRNPFVNIYRRLAAPSIWKEITDYFSPASIETVAQAFKNRNFKTRISRYYWLAFLATPLNYSLHWPRTYRFFEILLSVLDGLLFSIFPFLKKQCWFCFIEARSPESTKSK